MKNQKSITILKKDENLYCKISNKFKAHIYSRINYLQLKICTKTYLL